MKAVVVAPPIQDFYFTPRRDAGLAARLLARELMDHGVEAAVHLLSSAGRPRAVALPYELDYLRRFLVPGERGPTAWFGGYRRFGPEPASAAAYVLSTAPDVVFISCFAWAYADDALLIAREIRRHRPGVPIVIGGHGPSVNPDTFLNARDDGPGRPLFDLVAAGEVEGRVPQLLESMRSSERFVDLGRADTGHVSIRPKPVCAAPPGGAGRVSIMFTRGCPCSCDFCANFLVHGRTFRSSPPESWLACLEETVNRLEPHKAPLQVNIEDDNILHLREQFFGFLDSARSRYPGMSFSAENGLDYRLMRTDDVDRLKEAGFTELNLSLGTPDGSGARGRDAARFEALLNRAAEVRLPVTTHFICGAAGDSIEKCASTLRYLGALSTRIGISNFYPVPGIPGFEDPHIFVNRSPRLALGSSMYPWTGAIDTASMLTAFRLSRWLNLRQQKRGGAELSDRDDAVLQKTRHSGRLQTVVRAGKQTETCAVPGLNQDLVQAVLS